jgi:hypothetical protein
MSVWLLISARAARKLVKVSSSPTVRTTGSWVLCVFLVIVFSPLGYSITGFIMTSPPFLACRVCCIFSGIWIMPLPSCFESFRGWNLQRVVFPFRVSASTFPIFFFGYSFFHSAITAFSMRTVSWDARKPVRLSIMNWFTGGFGSCESGSAVCGSFSLSSAGSVVSSAKMSEASEAGWIFTISLSTMGTKI